MRWLERIKISLTGVWSNKFRSFLTLLGIIIGVSSVIIMVSLGSGTQKVVGGQFEGAFFQTGLFNEQPAASLQAEGGIIPGRCGLFERVHDRCSGCDSLFPYLGEINKYGDREYVTGVAGVTEKGSGSYYPKLEYGRDDH